MSTSTQVVVGYDGSPDSRAALDWAVREAASRHLGVRVVYCEPDLAAWDGAAATMSGAPALATTMPHHGPDLVAQAAEVVTRAGVPVETVATAGSTASVLVEQSRTASMVVIGSRGHGSISSAILGSTVSHVASHAHCPVIVAQERGRPDGPVVVGVDGSPESEELVGWAIDHASRHGLALEVLHSYAIPVYPGVVPYVPPVEISTATAGFEQRVTSEVLAGWREKYPDVEITTNVAHGRPAPALVEATGRASLTVVGSHGRGAFLGMLLGSTSHSLLHNAKGSVAVLKEAPQH
jgi:nucleotide-binding universal stress UspA family protein